MNPQEKVQTVLSNREFQIYKGEYVGYLFLPLNPRIFSYETNPFTMAMIVSNIDEYKIKLVNNQIDKKEFLKFKVFFGWESVIFWEPFGNRIKVKKGKLELI
jgi:hypothetical protein